MLCPKCRHATQVKDTRGSLRRRQCMNITCGERFVTDEILSDRPMPRTTAEANKLEVIDYTGNIRRLKKQVAVLESALKAATQIPEPEPEPVAEKPQTVAATPVQSGKRGWATPLRKPVSESRPAAFFSRESLVAEASQAVEIQDGPPPAASWMPRLPPSAFGRMR